MNAFREFAMFFILVEFPQLEFVPMGSSSSDSAVKYEPLYVIDKSRRFAISNLMTFDEKLNKLVIFAPKNYEIQLACPKKDDDGIILETVGQPITSRIPLGVMCDNPVEPYIEKFPNSDHYSVGFLIYKEDVNYQSVNLNVYLPPTQNVITLMVINFDRIESRPAYVWHSIDFGEWIQIESTEPINNQQYNTNYNIYGFHVDELYSESYQSDTFAVTFKHQLPCALVKIQLAPAEDFFLDNHKKMSRININSAPIWGNILPQWRALEKFVRKVAREIGKLHIITGTLDMLFFPISGNKTKPFFLKTTDPDKNLVPPKYFWKAVFSHHAVHNNPENSYGILFIMVNDPYFDVRKRRRKQKHLCPNIIKGTGWELHDDPNGTPNSIIYACALTRKNMKIVGGPRLPISKYPPFNLHNTVRRYYYEWAESRKLGRINVIRKLKDEGLL